jgi:ADP-ribosylglycohydrolase
MSDYNEKYIYTFLLHALGDTIGFKNGEWEFNVDKNTDLNSVIEFIYEFIDLGGVNGINLKGWIVSDDTMYHIAISKALLMTPIIHDNNTISETFISNVKKCLYDIHKEMVNEEKHKIYRYPGITTEKYIKKFSKNIDGRTLEYEEMSGGNGCAMRNLCIGLAFSQKKHLSTLIDVSIVTSKLTHNSPIGFLGGLTTALMVSLAIQNIKIDKWVKILLNVLDSENVKNHIDFSNNNILMDYMMYIRQWNNYYDTKFRNNKNTKSKSTSNLVFRIKYFYENFYKDSKSDILGGDGAIGCIMAYDALLDCGGNWEKLVFYSILHPGDSDTIGAIAGGLYGAYYGKGDVPDNMLKYLEKKNKLINFGKQFYKKYYK